ncbi:MAG: helix-turn-helix domain-containing protein [Candidatus Aminicenantes bacterium]|nr:helix-turn-helix domain-containing protein [Candidatus Aminicenantes bacterium]
MKIETLSQFKEKRQLTNKQLAELFGISEIYVAFLLSGKRVPSKRLALRISERTGIPVLNLLYPREEVHT